MRGGRGGGGVLVFMTQVCDTRINCARIIAALDQKVQRHVIVMINSISTI